MNFDIQQYAKKVLILLTGGTITKQYDPHDAKLDNDSTDEELITHLMANARVSKYEYYVCPICSVDSNQMDEDRIRMLKTFIINDMGRNDKIVVVHGTDRMVDVATKLGTIPGKTIVFTGAIIPECVRGSDAVFNLGFAYSCAKILDQGTYVAMNGNVFNHENVEKNSLNQTFVYTGD